MVNQVYNFHSFCYDNCSKLFGRWLKFHMMNQDVANAGSNRTTPNANKLKSWSQDQYNTYNIRPYICLQECKGILIFLKCMINTFNAVFIDSWCFLCVCV